jgi:hypothetical protein
MLYLSGGQQVKAIGRGPPVVFSSAFYGMIPHYAYGELFKHLKLKMTLIVPDEVSLPVTASLVESVADALLVDKVGFLAHSFFDMDVLASEKVYKAVLCDPCTFPNFDISQGGMCKQKIRSLPPVKIFESGKVRSDQRIVPYIQNGMKECYDEFGRLDVFDDVVSDLAQEFCKPNGVSNPYMSFADWNTKRDDNIKSIRSLYRRSLSGKITLFFNL